jgi:hypothetical protein
MVFVPANIPVRHANNNMSFVPSRLTLHLTKTIEINKDLNARRVSYGKDFEMRRLVLIMTLSSMLGACASSVRTGNIPQYGLTVSKIYHQVMEKNEVV